MSPVKAAVACKACRRLKRKCSRDFPSCSLCVRLNKICEYPGNKVPSTARLMVSVNPQFVNTLRPSQSPEGESILPGSGKTPTLSPPDTSSPHAFPLSYFLDPDHFTALGPNALCERQSRWGRDMPRFTPSGAMETCQRYMSTVHNWLPILSQKRLSHELTSRSTETEAANGLLLLSMKLCTQPCARQPESNCPEVEDVYASAKQRCIDAETNGYISLRLIESLVLLAVYELGHAIHPCAYLTIGRAARLCGLIGLHSRKHAQQLFEEPDTWTLREEQRRTWWAVFILDRVVNLGTSGLPFAAPEPGEDFLLPCCDVDWNSGKIGSNEPLLARTFHSSTHLGGFARTCQAAHMLSKVLTHIDPTRHARMDVTDQLTEALRFHEAFVVLDASLQEPFGDVNGVAALPPGELGFSALAICCSARFLLYNQYGCNERDDAAVSERIALETEAQMIAIRDIQMMASITVPWIARDEVVRRALAVASPYGSPLVAHCLYHAATECAWFIKENHEEKMYAALGEIADGLRAMQIDWRVGAEYLALLDKSGILELGRTERGRVDSSSYGDSPTQTPGQSVV